MFFDGLALQCNAVLEDLCIKVVHSKQEWTRLFEKSKAFANDLSRIRYWSQFKLPKRVNIDSAKK